MATDLGQTPPAFVHGFGLTLVYTVLHTRTHNFALAVSLGVLFLSDKLSICLP